MLVTAGRRGPGGPASAPGILCPPVEPPCPLWMSHVHPWDPQVDFGYPTSTCGLCPPLFPHIPPWDPQVHFYFPTSTHGTPRSTSNVLCSSMGPLSPLWMSHVHPWVPRAHLYFPTSTHGTPTDCPTVTHGTPMPTLAAPCPPLGPSYPSQVPHIYPGGLVCAGGTPTSTPDPPHLPHVPCPPMRPPHAPWDPLSTLGAPQLPHAHLGCPTSASRSHQVPQDAPHHPPWRPPTISGAPCPPRGPFQAGLASTTIDSPPWSWLWGRVAVGRVPAHPCPVALGPRLPTSPLPRPSVPHSLEERPVGARRIPLRPALAGCPLQRGQVHLRGDTGGQELGADGRPLPRPGVGGLGGATPGGAGGDGLRNQPGVNQHLGSLWPSRLGGLMASQWVSVYLFWGYCTLNPALFFPICTNYLKSSCS